MIRKIGLGLLALVSLLILFAFIAVWLTEPEGPPTNSISFSWLQSGPYEIAQSERLWVDGSRPTNPNGDFPGTSERTFPTTLWFPQDFAGPYPLIVYSHGFLSSRGEAAYLLEQLSSYGYVVVAADFPLTGGSAPGGSNINDVSNQPGDVSFLIDSVVALSGVDKPFAGEIDQDRIGIMGISLGGFSTSLTTYHPRLSEPRVKAAISIAGPSSNLSERFYAQSEVHPPFLMIAGTADRLIDYNSNAAIIPERVAGSALLTIEGGNHIGFVGIAEPALRFMRNSDSIACWSVQSNVEQMEEEVFPDLFSEADGIVLDNNAVERCQLDPPPEAGHPGRQHMITKLGVLGFFESIFSVSEQRRAEASELLTRHLAQDFSEVKFRVATFNID